MARRRIPKIKLVTLLPKGDDLDHMDFVAARATAIDTYSLLEANLCKLFSYLLGTTSALGAIPFFRINNARARNVILGKLLKEKHGGRFNMFWNSVVKQIGLLDEKRNQIIHWAMYGSLYKNEHGKLAIMPNLGNPNEDRREASRDTIWLKDLHAFFVKCNFYSSLVFWFYMRLSGEEPQPPRAWRGIFRRPVIYPPPDNHPIWQRCSELGSLR